MSSGLKVLSYTCTTLFAAVLPRIALAVTMGSLAPHDGRQDQQWITDLRTNCIAADPNYTPDDSIAWQGHCKKNGMIYGYGALAFLYKGQTVETITGTFTDGLLQPGHVSAQWSDGTRYEGDQLGGLFNGRGKFVSPKGDTLDGEWKMGELNGKASVVWANGDRYDGEWKNGRSNGQGVEVWADGRRFEGEWRDGLPVSDTPVQGIPTAAPTSTQAVPENPNATPASALAANATPALTSAQTLVQPAHPVAAPLPPPAVASSVTKTAVTEKIGNEAPNPALPLRTLIGTQLVAVDGATLELALTDDGFARTLVLPDGNSQEVKFAFANGPVGTVADGQTAIGVFRAKADELDIDFADGATESLGEAANGGLFDHAHGVDGHAMCTSWYPQGHVFSAGEKQAAVQEYASRLGVTVGAPAGKHRLNEASPSCGGAFIASGSTQKIANANATDKTPEKPQGDARLSMQSAQSADRAPMQRAAIPDNSAIAVRTSAVHLIDAPGKPMTTPPAAHLEQASFAPVAPVVPSQPAGNVPAAANVAPRDPGASDCLTVASNGEYWGFQNSCAKSVQFAYCEMGDSNPLTSCDRTTVSGSVTSKGFSPLVSDHSLAEQSTDHEFRWMACNGGAGEVVPHLDKFDPPSGRCERAIAPAN